ncbi:phage head-tail joining protein [Comamonas sp. SY3]|uniref:phage head-tail joining protein n=1 Tax=Comamonas sp. SY3 TaxID=3243601 RepID=UPI003593C60F
MNTSCNTEDIALLKQRVDSLNRAIATGARSVTLGSQTIIYNTAESLIKARDDMRRQLQAAQAACSTKRVSRQTYAVFGGRDY